jgi:3-oxoacyl-[acyl-carrier protein] reductase
MLYPNVIERTRAGTSRRRRRAPLAAEQRVALITGSWHGGLGRAIARRLARDGLAIAVHAGGDPVAALEVVIAIQRDGGIAGAFMADLGDEREVRQLAAAIAGSLGVVDTLVVDATGPWPTTADVEVARTLRRAVLDGMEAKGSGRIVKVDADILEPPRPDVTQSWARELASIGVTVNTVAPRFAAPPSDVAHAVSFLVSENAGYITGQRIVVDGGRGPVG